jgi:hypothetical protein
MNMKPFFQQFGKKRFDVRSCRGGSTLLAFENDPIQVEGEGWRPASVGFRRSSTSNGIKMGKRQVLYSARKLSSVVNTHG